MGQGKLWWQGLTYQHLVNFKLAYSPDHDVWWFFRTATDNLISNEFQPTRTLVLAFGFDEEISGTKVNRCLPGGRIIKCSWSSVPDRALPILPPYLKNTMERVVLLLLLTKEVILSTKCPRKPVEIGSRYFGDPMWHAIRSSRAGGEGEHECPNWGYCTRWAFEYTTWTYGKLLPVDA